MAPAPDEAARAGFVGAVAGGRNLRGCHHRDRRRHRAGARPRSLSRIGGASVPTPVSCAGRHHVREHGAPCDRRPRRDSGGRGSGQRRRDAWVRRRAAFVVSDQHDLSLDRRFARGRDAGGVEERCAPRHGAPRGGSPPSVRQTVSRYAVFLRAGRHRQSHHELWHVHARADRDRGARLRGDQGVRRQSPRRTRPGGVPARFAGRPGPRLSGDSGHRQSPACRSAGSDRRPGRTVVRGRDFVEPIRGAELLGRPAQRHRLSGAGRGAAAGHAQSR